MGTAKIPDAIVTSPGPPARGERPILIKRSTGVRQGLCPFAERPKPFKDFDYEPALCQ